MLLITVLARYLAHIFLKSILPTTKIIIVRDDIYQIYTCDWNTSYCITWLSVMTIALSFLKVLTGKLGIYF